METCPDLQRHHLRVSPPLVVLVYRRQDRKKEETKVSSATNVLHWTDCLLAQREVFGDRERTILKGEAFPLIDSLAIPSADLSVQALQAKSYEGSKSKHISDTDLEGGKEGRQPRPLLITQSRIGTKIRR